ncbi:hypothetical protein [Acetoanaerobium noterae]|uniref:hypothetical protein n=1 Tax=Acetoanaerobium noterae TaxID=745369 RepID=UPI00322201CE
MNYYEVIVTVLLKENLNLNQVGEKQGDVLKESMKNSEILSKLHQGNHIKLYCYDYLYPREEDKVYKKDRIYCFKLRTPVKLTAYEFSKKLNGFENDNFKVISNQLKQKTFHLKSELYTTTPAICTLGKKYWKLEEGLDVIEEKIEVNLVTKYKAFYNENPPIEKGFISYINIKNNKPITMKYKGGSLFGNKFLIGFSSDDISEKMAFLAYTTSILEKSSSLGSGFCI